MKPQSNQPELPAVAVTTSATQPPVQARAFLGEIGVLDERPRSATATTAKASVFLRVDKNALAELCRLHPPARAVLEETKVDRSSNPAENPLRERIRHED